MEAIIAFRSLRTLIEFGRLRFAESTWLRIELKESEPDSKVRKLLSLIPKADVRAILSAEVKKDALTLREKLQMSGPDKALADCRHLACARSVNCDYLVTFDAEFYEAMRQKVTIIGVRPVWMTTWREEIHGISK
jgi:predicted nucleic acid-binding protein